MPVYAYAIVGVVVGILWLRNAIRLDTLILVLVILLCTYAAIAAYVRGIGLLLMGIASGMSVPVPGTLG